MIPVVLVVDDDPIVRRTLGRILRRHARIVEAATGEEALALVVTGECFFHVLLCDHTPRLMMSRIDLFTEIQRIAPHQAERFFAFSDAPAELDPSFCAAIGNRILAKTIGSADLVAFLAPYLLDRSLTGV